MLTNLKKLFTDESGATLVEYGLLVALIAAVSIVIVKTVGTQVQGAFQTTSNNLPAAPAAG